jgi:DNA-binding beta-propeller fold protein YncE
MLKRWAVIFVIVVALLMGYFVAKEQPTVQGQARPTSAAAVASDIGNLDLTGPYEPVANWPKDLRTLPGNEKWTWGSGEGIFAESPNRVYLLQRGSLPVMPTGGGRGQPGPFAAINEQIGRIFPGGTYPVGGLARNATGASPPGMLDTNAPCGGPNQPKCIAANYDNDGSGKNGVDFMWQDCLVVADANGNIIERWNQWDQMFRRPHSVFISPYDPQKNVWVVDDYRHAIFKFTNDGKTLLQTIGTPNEHASDDKHFYRPTFMAWQPDGSFYVADGYANTRVVKFDKDGKYLKAWGEPSGQQPQGQLDKRPSYFNNVHGVAIDPQTRDVYVNDRGNQRIQVFDENGTFKKQWSFVPPVNIHFVYIGTDRGIVVFNNSTQHLAKFDLDGHLIYQWGGLGTFAGALWGAHGISVDQEGNLYLASVSLPVPQKFRPRPGANPAFLAGKPVKAAW